MLTVGVVFYGTEVDAAKLPAALIAFAVGAAAFSALGVAVAGLIRKAEAAPAVANAVILPMAFISNTFVAMDESDDAAVDRCGQQRPAAAAVRRVDAGRVQPDRRRARRSTGPNLAVLVGVGTRRCGGGVAVLQVGACHRRGSAGTHAAGVDETGNPTSD